MIRIIFWSGLGTQWCVKQDLLPVSPCRGRQCSTQTNILLPASTQPPSAGQFQHYISWFPLALSLSQYNNFPVPFCPPLLVLLLWWCSYIAMNYWHSLAEWKYGDFIYIQEDDGLPTRSSPLSLPSLSTNFPWLQIILSLFLTHFLPPPSHRHSEILGYFRKYFDFVAMISSKNQIHDQYLLLLNY